MKLILFVWAGTVLFGDAPAPKWEKGFVGLDRFAEFSKDADDADVRVSVDQDDKLDIGVDQADSKTGRRHSVSFSRDDLEDFFKRQRHKTFIVVMYHKNAPKEDLDTSLTRLKAYFAKAGYKRVLLTHAHSSGVIVHEDFRPRHPATAKP